MKIALFGRKFNDSFDNIINVLFAKLNQSGVQLIIFEPLHKYLAVEKKIKVKPEGLFNLCTNLPSDTDIMISIGGDGTFLEAITYIRDSGIPIVGINSGRLGFLANIAAENVSKALDNLITHNYVLEDRELVYLTSKETIFEDFPFALNEFTLQKTGPSLITIHVTIGDEYLTSYWSDGLIISTATGSTAYSLSLGGPLVIPESENFIITPIAAHNLNVRPLVIPDNSKLTLRVEGRTDIYLATLDSRSAQCGIDNEITISKASFTLKTIKLPDISFYITLRNKLMWGADKRN